MKKVLIIGESDIVQKSIINLLESLDISCEVCKDFNLAVSLLFKEKFALVISSFFMEGGDACQITKFIKFAGTVNSLTPIVVTTSEKEVLSLFDADTKPNHIFLKGKNLLKHIEQVLLELNIAKNQEPLNVLYIDDDPLVRKMVEIWLKPINDIHLKVFSSLNELSENINEEFDFIVSDNLLADGNIVDVLDLLESGPNMNKPVLVYTGSPDKVKSLGVGQRENVIDILPKPFELKKFLEIVKNT